MKYKKSTQKKIQIAIKLTYEELERIRNIFEKKVNPHNRSYKYFVSKTIRYCLENYPLEDENLF